MAFKVRLMTKQDIPEVSAIEERTFPHPFTAEDFTKALDNPSSQQFVIELFEDVIDDVRSFVSAYCAVNYLDETRAEIVTFAVIDSHRRSGQAKFLLEMVLRFMQSSRVQEVTLEVRPSNTAALKLYTSFDFEEVAVRKNYYTQPNEDAYLLQKKF